MTAEGPASAVSVVVLRSWPVRAGDWRAQFQVEATRVRGEIATSHALAEGARLKLRPSTQGWALARVADRP